jgi:hypothetical protein
MAGLSGNSRLPKDAQVIVSMLKEAGINEYEPRVVNQLLEFTYRKFFYTVMEAMFLKIDYFQAMSLGSWMRLEFMLNILKRKLWIWMT